MSSFFERIRKALATLTVVTIVFSLVSPAFAATTPLNNPGTAIDDAGTGSVSWSTPGNVTSDGSPYTNVTLNLGETSHYLKATNYGLSVPSEAIINGITLQITRKGSANTLGLGVRDSVVKLVKGGLVIGNNKAVTGTTWGTTYSTITYGSSSDLWGTTWTPSDVNSGNFGAVFSVTTNALLSRTATVDTVKVTVTYDLPPTITSITSSSLDGAYPVGAVIPINVTFSEAVTSTGNVTVTTDTGRTCTFTISNATSGTCNYTVQTGDTSSDLNIASVSGTIKDAANNAVTNFIPSTNLATNKNIVIDTTAPTVNINVAPTTLKIGSTSTVTFTFNEPVSGFDVSDITMPSGTLGAVGGGPIIYTATFTPTTSFESSTNVVTVGTSWADIAGNTPIGITNSANYVVDTVAPIVLEITPVITPSNQTNPQYVFNSTEAGTITSVSGSCLGFTSSSVVSGNNTVTFNGLSGSPSGIPYTDCAFSITDSAGNISNTLDISDFVIDTSTLPLAITMSDYAIKIGDSSTISFTFQEAPIGFDDTDVTVENGTFSPVTPTSPTVYTSIFTPFPSIENTSNIITVLTGWTDQVGNAPTANTLLPTPYSIDTITPTTIVTSITSNNANTALAKADDIITVLFTTSETINPLALADITIAGKPADSISNSGNNYTATYKVTPSDTQGTVTVALNFSDIAGNPGAQTTSTGTDGIITSSVTIDTVVPTISNIASTPLFPPGSAITWTTNEMATSQVEYGLTSAYGSMTAIDKTLVENHTVNVTGLSAPETYHFLVVTTDAAGNTTTSAIGGNTATTSDGGGAPFGSSGELSFQTSPNPSNSIQQESPLSPTPETQMSTPVTEENTASPQGENITPTGEPTENGTTLEETNNENGSTTEESTSTGSEGESPVAARETFTPASATLDIGGGPTPPASTGATSIQNTTEESTPQDIGGGTTPPEGNSNATLVWTLLGMVALLNGWWYFATRGKVPPVGRN